MVIENQQVIITKPWKGNSEGSVVVLIPKTIAEQSNLSPTSYVTIQGSDDGDEITIRKLNLKRLKFK